jgi:GTPase SAR1 family protein
MKKEKGIEEESDIESEEERIDNEVPQINTEAKFDISNKMILLVGKRNSGKSVLAKYLIEKSKPFDRVIVFCPTETINTWYGRFLDPRFIFEEYNELYLEALFKKLEKENANKSKEQMKSVLLILDDCVGDVSLRNSKVLKKIYVRSRHINLSLMVISQSLMELNPLQRANCDYICVSVLNHSSVESLADQYSSGRNFTKKDFIKMYYDTVVNFNWLCINNNCTKTNDVNEVYFSVKAEL